MEKPPIIQPPVKAKGRKRIGLSLAVIFGCVLYYTFLMPHPPKESELLQNFYAHRAAYEKLRDMFQADGHVNRIASYGVAITNSGTRVAMKAQKAGFPIDRYNEYLFLLKEAGASLASRREWEGSSDPIFLVWRWGGMDFNKHVAICWKEKEPTNQVASLYQGENVARGVKTKVFTGISMGSGIFGLTGRHSNNSWN